MVSGLEINGKELQNIRSASELTGYSRDYITKLAREQKIIASQISRQWFVDVESLTHYAKAVAEEQQLRNQQLSEERRRERLENSPSVQHKNSRRVKVRLAVPSQVMALGVLFVGLGLGFVLNKMPMFESGFSTQVASTPLVQSFQGHTSQVSGDEMMNVSGVTFSHESISLSTMDGSQKGVLLLPEQGDVSANPESLFSDDVKVMVDEDGNKFIARVDGEGNVVEKIPFVIVPVTSSETP